MRYRQVLQDSVKLRETLYALLQLNEISKEMSTMSSEAEQGLAKRSEPQLNRLKRSEI